MTNEEKVKKVVDNIFLTGLNNNRSFYDMAYDSAIRIAKWKEEQMIEKTVEWIDSIMYYVSKEDKRLICDFTDFNKLVNDFRKAMKEL